MGDQVTCVEALFDPVKDPEGGVVSEEFEEFAGGRRGSEWSRLAILDLEECASVVRLADSFEVFAVGEEGFSDDVVETVDGEGDQEGNPGNDVMCDSLTLMTGAGHDVEALETGWGMVKEYMRVVDKVFSADEFPYPEVF
jgi:hypothetical protein